MSKVFGIDLGTTFSAISSIDEYGKPEIYKNLDGDRITPSVILFEDEETAITGKYASQNAAVYKDQVVRLIKREMGKSKEEYSREFFGMQYSAPALSAIILEYLADYASQATGEKVKDVVITVPAYFDNTERNATVEAAEMAGLNVLGIINEPTAAAFAFGIDKSKKNETLFVFDLGGGTFDVTVVKISNKKIEVISSDGDHKLGGVDWDNKIVDYIANEFQKEYGIDPREDATVYQDMVNNANKAKHTLSRRKRDNIQILYKKNTLNIKLTKEKFEELTHGLVENCKFLCEQVLEDSKMTWKDIDQILMVGGSTRMPMIQEMVKNISGKELNMTVDPDEVVAIGAAYQATLLEMQKSNSKVSENVKEKLGGFETVDVNTHTLGCRINDVQQNKLVVAQMLKKDKPLPCEHTEKFSLSRAGQQYIALPIMQGESTVPDECVMLENLEMGPLKAGLSANEPVNVKFLFNKDGILEVFVECAGQKTSVKIKSAETNTKKEREKMKRHINKLKNE